MPPYSTLNGLVDSLCQQQLESQQSIDQSIKETDEWLATELQACKQKITERKRRRRNNNNNNNKKANNKRGRKKALPTSTAAPATNDDVNENTNIFDDDIASDEPAEKKKKLVDDKNDGANAASSSSTKAATAAVVSFKSPEPQPSLDGKVRQKVEGHRVKSLRKELKKRGMDDKGRKKELQVRLLSAIKKETHQQTAEEEDDDDQDHHRQQQKPCKENTDSNDEEGEAAAAAAGPDHEMQEVQQKSSIKDASMDVDEKLEPAEAPAEAPTDDDDDAKVVDSNNESTSKIKNHHTTPMDVDKEADKDSGTDSNNKQSHASPKKESTIAAAKPESSGRKRVRSPMRMVQSAIQRISATGKSPVHKKLQMTMGIATTAAPDSSSARSEYQKQPPKITESVSSVDSIQKPQVPKKQPLKEAMKEMQAKRAAKENQGDDATDTTAAAADVQAFCSFPTAFPDEEQFSSTTKAPLRLAADPNSATPWSAQPHQKSVKSLSDKMKASEAARKKARLQKQLAIAKNKPASITKPITTPIEFGMAPTSIKSSNKQLEAMRFKALGKPQKPQTTTSTAAAPVIKSYATKAAAIVNKHVPSSKQMMLSPKITQSEKKNNAAPQEVLSPMDTYEMSDHEGDTDSDDENSSPKKPKPKRIPNWARKQNLQIALERQFSGDCTLDPDEIFGEVQSCNLQEIFKQEKSRYKQRTSSGIWTNDRVTTAEKLAYKSSVHQHRSVHA